MGYQETIKKCGSMMQSIEILQGSTQHIWYPLLSVFAGEDAVKNVEIVKNVYQKCWLSDVVNAIPFVMGEKLGENDVKDSVRKALTRGPFESHDVFYQVFYWDIMDKNFDANFEVLKKKPYVPITYETRRIFYLFAKMGHEEEAQIAAKRGQMLIEWAQKAGEHVFILTDNTKDGFLNDDQLSENYQMAADITVISDSRSNDGKSLQLGFDLMKNTVYSAGYYSQGKNTRQIVSASIVSILDYYLSEMQKNTNEITGNIENYVGNYIGIFEQIFAKIYLPEMPQDTSFFRFLNYTDQMDAFYRSFEGGNRRHNLFFGNQQKEEFDYGAADAAKRSVAPFWQAILKQYYLNAAEKVLQTKRDAEHGDDLLRFELRSILTSKFSYYQLMSEAIKDEAARLQGLTEREVRAALPQVKNVSTPEAYFAQEMLRDVKIIVYLKFYHLLAEELLDLYKNAGSFSEKIVMVQNYYKGLIKDDSIRESYSHVVAKECASKPDYIKAAICPCKDVEELLSQIENVFCTFTKDINEYHLSFADELKWRMNAPGGGAVDEVISAAFAKDVSATARLSAFEGISGKIYSLIKESDVPLDSVNEASLGEIFDMPQSDQLERLLIYTLDSLTIIWV